MNPLDERDREILAKCKVLWDKIQGPRVGDFVQMLDGTKRRFTRDSLPLCGGGSFYFGPGWMSYSGGLDHSMPKERFQLVGLEPCGTAQFFHHNHAKAHNGVHFYVECRVYKELPA